MASDSKRPRTGEAPRKRSKRGFVQAGSLLGSQVRGAAESRGFSESRILTRWDEIAGPEIAAVARPVKVTYGRSFGATLVLACDGAHAPEVEMQEAGLRERVNGACGYNAVSRIRIDQSAVAGFAEAGAPWTGKPAEEPEPTPEALAEVETSLDGVADDRLREALRRFGKGVLTRRLREEKDAAKGGKTDAGGATGPATPQQSKRQTPR